MITPDFSGRSDNLLLFTNGDRGVIIDSNFGIVVASGQSELMRTSARWGSGEYSELDLSLASTAFAAMNSTVSAATGRMYTIPRGVQQSARRGVQEMNNLHRGGTDVSVSTATLLASGGQISFEKLRHVAKYFSRHENDKFSKAWNPEKDGKPSAPQITWKMWGGDAGQRWASAILGREADKALTADGVILTDDADNQADPFQSAYTLEDAVAPEFLARVRMDGSGIDRLYKIDTDSEVYVWDDGTWDNLCFIGGDIYQYDTALDDPWDTVEKTHIIIDASSAVILGSKLQNAPFACVSIEDIDEAEADLASSAMYGVDWELVDFAMVSAAVSDSTGPISDTDADPAEMFAGSNDVQDAKGDTATEGQQVIVGNNPMAAGVITKIDPKNGTVSVQLHAGGSVTVPGKSVSPAQGSQPGEPSVELAQPTGIESDASAAVPVLDTSSILATPRTPLDAPDGHIPTDLPVMSGSDLHDLLYNYPAWVVSSRAPTSDPDDDADGGIPPVSPESVSTANPKTSKKSTHPLVSRWLTKTNADGTRPTPSWKSKTFSITASSATVDPKDPESADVQPVYMAVVAPEDPTAVIQLIALVPASTSSPSPMVYARQNGVWVSSPQTLADLQSATPPPVVPLDSDTLQDVMQQVDSNQAKPAHKDNKTPTKDTTAAPAVAPAATGMITPPTAAQSATTASVNITADQALMVLWGPNLNGFSSLTAAGKGDAQTLRDYWTHGVGAAKIRWGEGGDFYRCVRYLGKYIDNPQGYCQDRHHDAIGIYTSTHAKEIRKAEGKK